MPRQAAMNIDETGHPENGKKLWTWGFHVPGPQGFTWFHIDPSRSTAVLYEFLGETFSGIIGCDYYSVYRKFLDETDAVMQFCWAHLIRDVKFLTTLTDPVTRPLRREVADDDQGPVSRLASSRHDVGREVGTRGPARSRRRDPTGATRAPTERGPEHRPTVPRPRIVLLHVSAGARRGADQQRHGAADAFRGH